MVLEFKNEISCEVSCSPYLNKKKDQIFLERLVRQIKKELSYNAISFQQNLMSSILTVCSWKKRNFGFSQVCGDRPWRDLEKSSIKKRYVKKTQSVRSRNKVVDGEPVAEQKTSLVSNRGIFYS